MKAVIFLVLPLSATYPSRHFDKLGLPLVFMKTLGIRKFIHVETAKIIASRLEAMAIFSEYFDHLAFGTWKVFFSVFQPRLQPVGLEMTRYTAN